MVEIRGNMKWATVILVCACVASCSPSKRIQRIAKNHPEVIQTDTVTVHDTIVLQSVRIDTTTVIVPQISTEVINNERVRLVYRFDTITNEIHHTVECKGDTIVRVLKVPHETIKIQPEPKRTDWKFWGLLILFVLVLLLQLRR